MKIFIEDIAGYRIEGEIVSANHATADEVAQMKADDIILINDIQKDDGQIYFCDRSGEQL
jgi:hypothetical protein